MQQFMTPDNNGVIRLSCDLFGLIGYLKSISPQITGFVFVNSGDVKFASFQHLPASEMSRVIVYYLKLNS